MMRESGRLLERAVTELILIACGTAHYFLPELRRALSVPVLSILEETAAAVLRELPRLRKIGLQSTTATARSRLFPGAFAAPGVEILVPRSHDIETNCEIIERIKTLDAGQDTPQRGPSVRRPCRHRGNPLPLDVELSFYPTTYLKATSRKSRKYRQNL